jgi:putrescine:ornithine antiporter
MKRAQSAGTCGYRVRIATVAIAFLTGAFLPLAQAAGTLDRVRDTGRINLGYRADARPFSFKDDAGKATGYSVALCQKIAEQVKTDLKLPTLNVVWVPVTLEGRFQDVQQGRVDMLCGADTETLARRKEVSFSIPIFPGGIGALLRADAPLGLREVLSKGRQAGPFWRGSPAEILNQQTFAAVPGTTAERWLGGRVNALQIDSKIVSVPSYEAGIKSVLDRSANAFFGDRAILLDAAKRSPSAGDLIVLDRRFTTEQISLALPRDSDDFRLVVDATLSRFYGTTEFRALYTKWFGEPDAQAMAFFRANGLPD